VKIRSWSIDGFGVFRNYEVRDLPDGVTIVHGPNEAGKSTLLWFLRGMLFGFPDGRRNAPAYLPQDGGRHGGRVVLQGPEGEYIIDRQASPRRTCHVAGPSGARIDEARLPELLGGADERVFRNIFAFSLTELMGLRVLTTAGIRERIFSAGVAGAGQSARAAIERLEESRTRLARPRGPARVTTLLSELQALHERLDERKRAAGRYVGCLEDERQTRLQLERLGGQLAAARNAQTRVRQLIDLWPLQRDLLETRSALAGLEQVDAFPEDARDRLSAVRQAVDSAERAVEGLQGEQRDLERRRKDLSVDDRAKSVAVEVDALARELVLHRERLAALPQVGQRRMTAEGRAAGAIAELGPGWDAARVRAFDRPLPQRHEVREWERRLAHAMRTLDEARAAVCAAEVRDAECAASQARITATRPEDEPPERHVLAEQETVMRRLRINVLEYRAGSAEREGRDGSAQPVLESPVVLRRVTRLVPRGLAYGMGLVAMVMVGAALWGPLGERGTTAAAWAAGVLGVMGVLWLVVRRADHLPALHAAPRRSRGDLRSLEAAVQEDAGRLGLGTHAFPSLAAIEEREKLITRQLAERMTWEGSERQLEAVAGARARADDDVAGRRAAVESAERRLEDARRGWEEWKSAEGLPAALPPSAVLDLVETLTRARASVEADAGAQEEARRCAASIHAWEVRARGALHAMGDECARDIEGEDLVAAIHVLVARCAQDAETRRALGGLVVEGARLDAKRHTAEGVLANALEARRALFAAVDATDESEFLRRLHACEQQRGLTARIREREEEIGRRLADAQDGDALRETLGQGSLEEWRERQRALGREVTECEHARDAALRRHRDAETLCRELEESADIASLEGERQALVNEIGAGVQEWRVCTLARALIEETLREFERSRQPRVLAQASDAFRDVTEGRYTRIVPSEGQELAVLGHDGRRREVATLSRGTAEQLYLCIRLGLVDEFSYRSVSLPVIMDDVLVNFDPGRARGIARQLARFAERHQVLLFTCHPAICDLVAECAPGARIVELNGDAGASHPQAVPERRRREVLRELA